MEFHYGPDVYQFEEGSSVNPWFVKIPDGRILELDWHCIDGCHVVDEYSNPCIIGTIREEIFTATKKENSMLNNVYILTPEEAKEVLVEHYVDFLTSNPSHLKDLLRNGKLASEIPDLSDMPYGKIVSTLRDNALGAKVAKAKGADMVVMKLNPVDMALIYSKT